MAVRQPITFKQVLKPLLISLKLCGLYYEPNSYENCVNPVEESPKKLWIFRKYIPSGLYSGCFVLCLWFNFIRGCVGLEPSMEGFSSRIIFTTWFGLCALNGTIFFICCRKLTKIPNFLKHWDAITYDCLASLKICNRNFCQKHIIVSTVIGWICVMFNTVTVLYLINGDLSEARKFGLNMVRPFQECFAARVVCSVLHVMDTMAWILPVVFMVVLPHMIKINFNDFSECLKKHINQSDDKIPPSFEAFRKRHLQMCAAVATLDGTMTYLIGVCFFFNIILACFNLYQIVSNPFEVFSVTLLIFWQVASISHLLVVAIYSAQVNDAAHSPLDQLYLMTTRGASAEDVGQLQLFISKLSGNKVGFSVLNMVVVTKELILTIGGAFVTYFFLLLQFRLN